MRRSLTFIALVTVLLISLVGAMAVPMAAQSATIATEISNGDPGETVTDTTVTLSNGDAVDVTIKAENASAADVDIERNTTNTVTVTVDANGNGTVDAMGVVQTNNSARLDVDTNTDVPMSLRLALRPTGV